MLSLDTFDLIRLRVAFVVYGAMNRRDWRTVTTDDVAFDPREISSQLLPSLPASAVAGMDAAEYGRMLVEDCQRALSALLPFDEEEHAFLDRLLDHGEIDGALLTTDEELQRRDRCPAVVGMESSERAAASGVTVKSRFGEALLWTGTRSRRK